ncbi:M48 family metallopeptidase [bacterium]|nr:M48 family metallopeptidase [bacterium]
MKNFWILLFVGILSVNAVFARDYAKLQEKEMKHAQKYGTTNKYFENENISNKVNKELPVNINFEIKDPKLLKLDSYEKINSLDLKKKITEDEVVYSQIHKSLCKRTIDNYDAQAKGEDYYKIYRIAERIIRSNKLDYLNWRIGIYRDTENFNAYSTGMNYIAIATSAYDTFSNNDDALAMLIGHEMGHALLGHQQRSTTTLNNLEKYRQLALAGNSIASLTYAATKRKYLIDSKNMEYAADIEGAKLAAKAGYDLDKGVEVISFLNTLPQYVERRVDHPNARHRLENFYDNRKYFIEDQWKDIGEFNIYNSAVLPVKLSSDRKSIVINSLGNSPSESYYRPETMEDLYLRFAYKYYINREFRKSDEYFNKYFDLNGSNPFAYLYASYNADAIYVLTKNKSYLQKSKDYINKAYRLDNKNKYIKEQYDNVNL